jgi:spore maturation protein CgeB
VTRHLRLVVIGLTLSSSWGNGHATTYRALLRAFAKRGHDVAFLEQDQSWYADHRDLARPDFCRLLFYRDPQHLKVFRDLIAAADAVIIGSYVASGAAIGRWVQGLRRGVTAFYDIDTPLTLAKLERVECDYLAADLIPFYDPYLSFSGGPALETLERRYRAPAARPLHCAADETFYRPLALQPRFDLGYLGTYSADRQSTLERLLIEPARRAPHLSFVVAGPQFPGDIAWPTNVTRFQHVGPADHPAFYASCRFTLNVTRADMARLGFSPSVRLFEAAACASPIISDRWPGVDSLFQPGQEILLADQADEALAILLHMDEADRYALGEAARRRLLSAHRASHRAEELERHLFEALARARHNADRPSPVAPLALRRDAPARAVREATALRGSNG